MLTASSEKHKTVTKHPISSTQKQTCPFQNGPPKYVSGADSPPRSLCQHLLCQSCSFCSIEEQRSRLCRALSSRWLIFRLESSASWSSSLPLGNPYYTQAICWSRYICIRRHQWSIGGSQHTNRSQSPPPMALSG